ncbi:ribonuclease [Parasphingopyxis algicola]|uniref:ribonuclease n=1 Tax=Parasphingopyxis algicola TaxID=2026624 RepID=UPI0015A14F26|nr:ribonuclease [Parasphingopyxis algicola]QLC25345.1 ribonuclease [Parasphingopyxis algicola]
MAEWLYEDGIGEARAALVEDGAIVEAHIETESGGARPGAICEARLAEILPNRRTGRLELVGGEEALIDPLPAGVTEGATLRVEIVRSAIPEPGRRKRARAKPAAKTKTAATATALRDRLTETGTPVQTLAAHDPDALEAAGWSELLEQAATGAVPFPGGALRIALTPAMAVIDVDGALPPAELARAGARAAGAAIRKFDIGGSTVIDLPSLASKAERQAAAEALDAALPQPFERTAVNGFGLLQIVRRRVRPSLLELAQHESAPTAARALLRRAERVAGSGARTLTAHPAIIAHLEGRPEWRAALERRIGAPVALRADPATGLWGGHISAEHPA